MKLSSIVKQQLRGKKKLPKMARLISPKSVEREYERAMLPILKKMSELINSRVLSRLGKWQKELNYVLPENTRTDSVDDELLSAIEEVKLVLYREYTTLEIQRLAQKVGVSVSEYNEFLIKNNYKRVLGFDIFLAQPYLKQELNMFVTMNTSLIQNLTDATIKKVEGDVMRGLSAGTRWEEIAKDIEGYIDPLDGTVRNRARLIARDQVNKLNGQLTELRQSELGVRRYIWRTSLDERVRPEHLIKEGKIYSWDDPPEDTGHPGEDINCRCYAEPVLSDLLESVTETSVNTEDE